eukprot:6523162-Pyramimonas_sp.AAC.1
MCRDLRAHGRGDAASRLAIAVSGGYVTQHELFSDRRVVDGQCQWCKRAMGAKSHRFYDCDAQMSSLSSLDLDEHLDEARLADECDVGYARCLFESPEWQWPAPFIKAEPRWSCVPPSGLLDSGYICLDGSGLDQDSMMFAQAGYAVVGLDEGGNIHGSLYGPLPHLLQLAGCGEVHALL